MNHCGQLWDKVVSKVFIEEEAAAYDAFRDRQEVWFYGFQGVIIPGICLRVAMDVSIALSGVSGGAIHQNLIKK